MDHFFNTFFVFRKILKNLKEGQIVLYIIGNSSNNNNKSNNYNNKTPIAHFQDITTFCKQSLFHVLISRKTTFQNTNNVAIMFTLITLSEG